MHSRPSATSINIAASRRPCRRSGSARVNRVHISNCAQHREGGSRSDRRPYVRPQDPGHSGIHRRYHARRIHRAAQRPIKPASWDVGIRRHHEMLGDGAIKKFANILGLPDRCRAAAMPTKRPGYGLMYLTTSETVAVMP
jgi:hypothetical protein